MAKIGSMEEMTMNMQNPYENLIKAIDLLLRLGLIAVERHSTSPINYDEFLYQIEARKKTREKEIVENST